MAWRIKTTVAPTKQALPTTRVALSKKESDSDGDGIADKDDPCPNAPGAFGGCPDTDGDGLADNLDKCPTMAGAAGSNGCPEVKKETKDRLAFATQAVQFETGKAKLKTSSYGILDEIVEILRQYPDYKLAISGHTDDVGAEKISHFPNNALKPATTTWYSQASKPNACALPVLANTARSPPTTKLPKAANSTAV